VPIWKQLLLSLYYYGTCPLRRWNLRRAVAQRRVPIVVLYYHRVADDGANDWTISNRLFARHVRWLRSRLELISLEEAQRRIRSGKNARPCASITFDDGYADNCREAIPLLIKERIPCTYFVTLQNLLDGQPFAHDLAEGHMLAPNTPEQIRAMAAAGIEIGAHTRTHPDLAAITDPRRLEDEIAVAGEELQQAVGRPVRYFAFPFGLHAHLSQAAFEAAHRAGYEAVCSAYGGLNFPGDDPFHLQRIPADDVMIRLKNWTTLDPRKLATARFVYEPFGCEPFAAGRMSSGLKHAVCVHEEQS